MNDTSKKVRRPAGTRGGPPIITEPLTLPGDHIELGLTGEVTDKRGRKWWLKAGLTSQQRPDEDTEDATERVLAFVVACIERLQEDIR